MEEEKSFQFRRNGSKKQFHFNQMIAQHYNIPKEELTKVGTRTVHPATAKLLDSMQESSTKVQKRLQPAKRRSELLTLAELSLRHIKAMTWLMTKLTRNRWRRHKSVWLRKEARGDKGVFLRHICK